MNEDAEKSAILDSCFCALYRAAEDSDPDMQLFPVVCRVVVDWIRCEYEAELRRMEELTPPWRKDVCSLQVPGPIEFIWLDVESSSSQRMF